MAGNHADTSVHRIVSGEVPSVGLRIYTNNLDEGVISKVSEDEGCGYYCNAWHDVLIDIDFRGEPIDPPARQIMNCDRLTTRRPT